MHVTLGQVRPVSFFDVDTVRKNRGPGFGIEHGQFAAVIAEMLRAKSESRDLLLCRLNKLLWTGRHASTLLI